MSCYKQYDVLLSMRQVIINIMCCYQREALLLAERSDVKSALYHYRCYATANISAIAHDLTHLTVKFPIEK